MLNMASLSAPIDTVEEPAAKRRKKRDCHFDNSWLKEFKYIGKSIIGINENDQ
jgi:hypothetical protein